MMTIEETKIKRCEMDMSDVCYEGELTLCLDNGETVYLSASLYSGVWGLAITKNSNYLYRTTGEGDEDMDYLEFYQSKEEMSKASKYRKYFNHLIAAVTKIAKSNDEYSE